MIVCYDLEFPEWVRAAALAGAELLCVPTNWPREPRPAGERPMEVLRTMVAAATNRMAVAVCDRCGTERGVEWVAGTAIAGPDGWLLAGPPVAPEPVLVLADVDLAAARDKAVGPRNDALLDRRPALYAQSAGDPAPRDPVVTAARTPGMRVTITGATGRVGQGLVAALTGRGDQVTVLSRNPGRAGAALGVEAVAWQPEQEPAPAAALAGATRSSTSPARTPPSGGTRRPSGGCAPRASWGRATWSPACAPPSRAQARSCPPPRSATTVRTATSR